MIPPLPADAVTAPRLPGETASAGTAAAASEPAAERAARRLRERIAAARLAPGTRLGEVALAEELGVSRNSLREAFVALAAQGLVVRVPHRGVTVAQPGPADVAAIFRTRRVTELGALRWGRLDDGIRACLQEVCGAVGEGDEDVRALGDANQRLHEGIVRLLHAPDLERLMDGVLARLRLAFQPMDVLTDLHLRFAARNRMLAELIVDGRLEQAEAILEPYLAEAEALVLAHLRERAVGG